MVNEFKDFLTKRNISFYQDIRLAEKTWIHRGPVVPFYILPHTTDEMYEVFEYCSHHAIDHIIIGHTSNIYFTSTYRTTAVISTAKMTDIQEKDGYWICSAGVKVSSLAKECIKRGYDGFEGLIDLPGTIGGAIVNNSSCFNCSISALLLEITIVTQDHGKTKIITLSNEDLAFTKRSSALKRKEITGAILAAKLKTSLTSDYDELQKKAIDNSETRKKTQEGKAHNLGSIFSSYKVKPLGIMSLGIKKAPQIFFHKIQKRFLNILGLSYKRMIPSILSIYGYKNLIRYVSPKNINCFIWKDSTADTAFLEYIEFMNKYAECGPLEIEILK